MNADKTLGSHRRLSAFIGGQKSSSADLFRILLADREKPLFSHR
jgi:hypothetical protein